MHSLSQVLLDYRYWVIFPLACLEGPLIAFLVGSLVALGVFSLIPAFAILVAGDIIPDLIYYLIGHFGQKNQKIAAKVGKLKAAGLSMRALNALWRRYTLRMMVLGKLAYGLSTPLLISAGLSRMPVARFLLYAVPVSMLQYALCLAVGYFVGTTFTVSASVLAYVQVAALAVMIVAGLHFGLRRWLSKRLLPVLPPDER